MTVIFSDFQQLLSLFDGQSFPNGDQEHSLLQWLNKKSDRSGGQSLRANLFIIVSGDKDGWDTNRPSLQLVSELKARHSRHPNVED